MHENKKKTNMKKIAFNSGTDILNILITKITNHIRKLIQENIYLSKPF